jgi:prolipoprotein diacylglyceryltransferase
LIAVYLKYRRFTAGLYLIGYAAVRFGMEFLRGDPRANVSVLSIGQTISIAMAVFGAVLVALESKRKQ